MADKYNIYRMCQTCSGRGKVKKYEGQNWHEITCPQCEGKKQFHWGQMGKNK